MNIEEIKKSHPTGLKGIFYFYDWNRLRRSQPFKLSLILTIVLAVCLLFSNQYYFHHVQAIVDLGLSIFPSLLGFTIGGFALIIGFASSSTLKKFTEKSASNKGSYYQSLMSIFSVAILLQTACIICCFIAGYIIKSKYELSFLSDCFKLKIVTNYVTVVVISFLSLWSIFTIPFVATNLFNFGQTNHLVGTIDRELEEENDDNKTPN